LETSSSTNRKQTFCCRRYVILSVTSALNVAGTEKSSLSLSTKNVTICRHCTGLIRSDSTIILSDRRSSTTYQFSRLTSSRRQ
uniref:Secreted protein n=1 Tax=Ascaris lumbricoides TaxID=6252 RepID=A0A0M3IWE0_ASCLU